MVVNGMDETRATNIRANYITTFRDIKILTAASLAAREYSRWMSAREKFDDNNRACLRECRCVRRAKQYRLCRCGLPDLFPFSPLRCPEVGMRDHPFPSPTNVVFHRLSDCSCRQMSRDIRKITMRFAHPIQLIPENKKTLDSSMETA